MEVKWIKLNTDMFDNSKIKYIRTLPSGNDIVLIWVMLLTKAGKCNSNGYIFLTESIPYSPEMLGAELGFETSLIILALTTFQKLNMIQLEEQKIYVNGWLEHQNIDGLEKIREQTRKRMAKYRENKKVLLKGSDVTSDVTVTESYATDKNKKENRKEEDIEIYRSVISYLNDKTNSNFKCTTKKTKSLIDARLKESFTIEDFKTVIDKKTKEWLNDTKMVQYLRPQTLFGTNFESYLNQKEVAENGTKQFAKHNTENKFANFKPKEPKVGELEQFKDYI